MCHGIVVLIADVIVVIVVEGDFLELEGKDVSFIFINWLTRDLPLALFLLRHTPVSSFATSLPSSLTMSHNDFAGFYLAAP